MKGAPLWKRKKQVSQPLKKHLSTSRSTMNLPEGVKQGEEKRMLKFKKEAENDNQAMFMIMNLTRTETSISTTNCKKGIGR